MKVRIERDLLADGIAWAARALPARPVVPVLAGLRLTASAEGLGVSAYNYEVSAGIEVAADVGGPGEILVPGRLFADIARTLPREHPVEITADATKARVTCAGSYFALPLLPLDDYPATPLLPETAGTVAAAPFAEAVAQVAIAAARDESLPVLTAIRVHLTHDTLVLAATDRYRLAVRRVPWQSATEDPDRTALVPAKVLADIARAAGSGADVRLALGSERGRRGLLGLSGGARHATSRLLDNEFPAYEWLFANETTAVATIGTAPLIEALKRVSLVVTRNSPVRLSFGRDALRIAAGTTNEAEAAATLPAELAGEPVTVAFNPVHLLDGLTALRAPTARMLFSGPTKPTVLTEDTASTENAGNTWNTGDPDYRYLLMPMRGA
ncbi:DNA polymerase III subunit beta [Embleya sp. NBC_00896]|uniref:DNA polymerase III subunit beta n=1 Tax=Embleya sp. NBC_00896 TaxID=2975961 RepID=UPI002F90CDEC|nr:DNA polymerase III subunit beta [Embleya sp. NBC_00896]